MQEPVTRETRPAVEVENKTYWSNHEINLPFSVNEGVRSTLGLFLVNPDSPVNNKTSLGVQEMHKRTGYFGRVLIRDHGGVLYRDVDLKGTGFLDIPSGQETLKIFPLVKKGKKETWGTWRKDKALRERDITEDLISHGVRTYRMAAIIDLEQIALPTGELITVQEAKCRGLMNETEEPVVGVRVYRNRDRINHGDQNSLEIYEQAKRDIEDELGRSLSWEEYIN